MKKSGYILTINGKIIGYFDSVENAHLAYLDYARKTPSLGAHRMRVDVASNVDKDDVRKFDDCKNPTEILEMLYFWAADYKECDQPVDPWIVSGKIKEAMIALEKLKEID